MKAPLHEARTTLFARLHDGGTRQWLGYSLRADITEDVSVAIPVPIAPGRAEEVSLHSLQSYPTFFAQVEKPFRRDWVERPLTRSRGPGGAPEEVLEVVQLGDYAATIAPDAAALSRVSPEFGVSPEMLEELPGYATFAFVILRLRAPRRATLDVLQPRKPIEHHAVLIDIPTSSAGRLFFPTVVAENGVVPESVRYDHLLFCQTRSDRQPEAGWERSARHVGRYVSEEAAPAVDTSLHVYRRSIRGIHSNQDLWLTEPVSLSARRDH